MPSTAAPSKNRPSAQQTLILWKRYRDTNDPALRDRLILTFAPLVKFIVYRKVREMPARCEVEDFISCGLEALIQSIDRYDPSKGATLEQYAWTRIHGAVLDELRRMDWAPRSVRRWERDMDKAIEEFTVLHGRRPGTEELAESMGVTVEQLRQRRDEIATSDLTSLNTLVMGDDDSSIERMDTIASTDSELDPEHAAGKSAAKDKFRVAFARLSQREREVAVMLYVKNLTLAEIGEVLGVSESRICQIHGQMKKTLRENLIDDAELMQLVA
jgi:RNA polymerase sigma factor for flagellar operon FliA